MVFVSIGTLRVSSPEFLGEQEDSVEVKLEHSDCEAEETGVGWTTRDVDSFWFVLVQGPVRDIGASLVSVEDVHESGVDGGVSLGVQVDSSEVGDGLAGDSGDSEVSLTIQIFVVGVSVAAEADVKGVSCGVSVWVVGGCTV